LPEFGFVPVRTSQVLPEADVSDLYALCVDDAQVGYLREPQKLAATVRSLRRLGQLVSELSVFVDDQNREVRLTCCGSRVLRPLLRVSRETWSLWAQIAELPGDAPVDFGELERAGLLEFVDAQEALNLVVAISPADLRTRLAALEQVPGLQDRFLFTHMEIDASMILGVSAALIPFADHNNAARNSFETGMSKQAIDAHMPAAPQTTKHFLEYPQRMLVRTRMTDVAQGLTEFRSQTVKVVILPTGGNQEDASDIAKAAKERGLFLTTRYRTERDQQGCKPGHAETFERPDPGDTVGMQYSPTCHLAASGVPSLGAVVNTGDIAIGKTTALRKRKYSGTGASQKLSKRCASTIYQGTQAVACRVTGSATFDGEQVRKVVTRQVREIEVGDKLNSFHAQKTTVAEFIAPEDAPVSLVDGTSGEVFYHPNGIFNRRTHGHMDEMLAGKTMALRPSAARKLGLDDATVFSSADRLRDHDLRGDLLHGTFDELLADVKRHGFRGEDENGFVDFCFARSGKERMMCGKTGRMIDAHVFVGLGCMQRLLQFVADKIYAAFMAQKTVLLQYRGGRADLGGMRVGTMEVDVLAAHGVAFIMHESLVTLADPCTMYFCGTEGCGNECLVDSSGASYCGACRKHGVAVRLQTVQAFKRLYFEAKSMGVVFKLQLESVPTAG
jgi:DNA-directed RNA polymerase beta subunit